MRKGLAAAEHVTAAAAAAAPSLPRPCVCRLAAPSCTPTLAPHLHPFPVLLFSLNSTLNLLIKWTLGQAGGFHFPLLLTCCEWISLKALPPVPPAFATDPLKGTAHVLIVAHMAVGFIVLGPVAAMEPWNVHVRMWHKQGQGVALIGMLMVRYRFRQWSPVATTVSSYGPRLKRVVPFPLQALNISLNNLSLTGISLSLNQIIR